ncbi:MAG TPA: zinc ribbon domain-containing protein [Pyrinomonadaceae bacterium]
MSSTTCTKCGAEMTAGARFCRRCGQPAPEAPAQSVLEAETRVFATRDREPNAATQHINSPLTGPAYMSPGEMPAPPAAPVTKSLQPSSSTTRVLLAGLVLLLLIFPIALVAMKLASDRNSRPETPVVTVPEIPPPPAPPSGSGGSAPISSALVYPNAKTLLDVTKRDGHVLQLRTSDPTDKVVQWYTDKIKPSETVKVPGGNMTILRSEDIRAIITSVGNETDIIIRQGGDEE